MIVKYNVGNHFPYHCHYSFRTFFTSLLNSVPMSHPLSLTKSSSFVFPYPNNGVLYFLANDRDWLVRVYTSTALTFYLLHILLEPALWNDAHPYLLCWSFNTSRNPMNKLRFRGPILTISDTVRLKIFLKLLLKFQFFSYFLMAGYGINFSSESDNEANSSVRKGWKKKKENGDLNNLGSGAPCDLILLIYSQCSLSALHKEGSAPRSCKISLP